jgi:hypothetical protein
VPCAEFWRGRERARLDFVFHGVFFESEYQKEVRSREETGDKSRGRPGFADNARPNFRGR